MTKEKLDVCIISPGLPIPPSKGGAIEMLIFETLKHYKKSKIRVYSEDVKVNDVSKYDTANVEYIQFFRSPLLNWLQKFFNRCAGRGLFSLYHFFFIRDVLRHLDAPPDVFHLHNSFYYIPLIRKRYPDARIILHMNNDFLFDRPYLKDKYNKILSKLDCLIACSKHVADRVITHSGMDSSRVRVVHNGVSLNRFMKLSSSDSSVLKWRQKLGFGENDKVLIFVGRVCEIKGVEVLIRAFAQLLPQQPGLKLLIVGSSWFAEGEETPYLKKLSALSLPFKDSIKFSGFISHDELTFLYNLSSICVVPSLFNDPCPLVLFEGMASGCAMVGSIRGGIPEVIKDQERGLLVRPNDVQDLADKIKRLLDNEDLRRELVSNSMAYVQRYSDWAIITQNMESIYFECMERDVIGKN